MSWFDGNKAANDNIIQSANFAAMAALKAPKMADTKIKVEIITGDNLKPVAEILGIIGETNTFVYGDAVCLEKSFEKGVSPVTLLIGADAITSELNWNCGACGFDTCAEFNKYSKQQKSTGVFYAGPSCNWKVFDVGMAATWAAASMAQLNIENRVQTSVGFAALNLGYLSGCSISLGITMGPAVDLYYYDRPELAHSFDHEEHEQFVINCIPQLYQSFVGGGHPMVKHSDNFFADPKFFKPTDDPDFLSKQQDVLRRVGEVIQREMEKSK